jgi:hypothetical protein
MALQLCSNANFRQEPDWGNSTKVSGQQPGGPGANDDNVKMLRHAPARLTRTVPPRFTA